MGKLFYRATNDNPSSPGSTLAALRRCGRALPAVHHRDLLDQHTHPALPLIQLLLLQVLLQLLLQGLPSPPPPPSPDRGALSPLRPGLPPAVYRTAYFAAGNDLDKCVANQLWLILGTPAKLQHGSFGLGGLAEEGESPPHTMLCTLFPCSTRSRSLQMVPEGGKVVMRTRWAMSMKVDRPSLCCSLGAV